MDETEFLENYEIKVKKMPEDFPKYTTSNSLVQQFSIPPTVIKYMFQRSNKTLLQKSFKYLFKLYTLCKSIFTKLRVIPCHQLHVANDLVHISYGYLSEPPPEIEFADLSHQQIKDANLHFLPEFLVSDAQTDENISELRISKFIPWICNFKIQEIRLENQDLTFKEYKFLCFTGECIVMYNIALNNCRITNGNGSLVPVEDLFAASTNVWYFSIFGNDSLNYCTPFTSQKLAALPLTAFLSRFSLQNVPLYFDPKDFAMFIKKNLKEGPETTYFVLEFEDSATEEFEKNFKQVVEAIVSKDETKNWSFTIRSN